VLYRNLMVIQNNKSPWNFSFYELGEAEKQTTKKIIYKTYYETY